MIENHETGAIIKQVFTEIGVRARHDQPQATDTGPAGTPGTSTSTPSLMPSTGRAHERQGMVIAVATVKKEMCMENKSAVEQIDVIIKMLGDWRGETLSRLRALIKQARFGCHRRSEVEKSIEARGSSGVVP